MHCHLYADLLPLHECVGSSILTEWECFPLSPEDNDFTITGVISTEGDIIGTAPAHDQIRIQFQKCRFMIQLKRFMPNLSVHSVHLAWYCTRLQCLVNLIIENVFWKLRCQFFHHYFFTFFVQPLFFSANLLFKSKKWLIVTNFDATVFHSSMLLSYSDLVGTEPPRGFYFLFALFGLRAQFTARETFSCFSFPVCARLGFCVTRLVMRSHRPLNLSSSSKPLRWRATDIQPTSLLIVWRFLWPLR